MPSSSIVLLFSAAFTLTSALPWMGPKPTTTYDPAKWTLRPTQAPVFKHQLSDRAWFFSADTCGWVQGDYNVPITCAASSSCVWDTSRSFVGCCPIDAPCTTGVYTGCVDVQSGSQTVHDPGVTTCSGSLACYANIFPKGYFQYSCGSTNLAMAVETTFFGQPATYHIQIVTTSIHIPTATVVVAHQSLTANSSNSATDSSTPTAVVEHSKKKSTGAIIGGVIGGIAIAGILIWLGRYLLRKRSEYHRRRPGRNKSRSEKSFFGKSALQKNHASQSRAVFRRLSNDAQSPEMRIINPPTFPPPPKSHMHNPAPQYISEYRSPGRSPTAHIPPRFSPKRLSPFDYVPYTPRPKTPRPLSPIIPPSAFEAIRSRPKIASPFPLTPMQESQREGQLIPLTPGPQATEVSPFVFLPNQGENNTLIMEPRQVSPTAFIGRVGGQSPIDTRNIARGLTPSPSQQSIQNSLLARDIATPSPTGSVQPLLQQSQNANIAREVTTPPPTLQVALGPIELPAPLPIKNKSAVKSKHKRNPSAVTYTTIPTLQESPPRPAQRKLVSKAVESASLSTIHNSNQPSNHIALQLTGSPSQSLALKPKTSQRSLVQQSSRTDLNTNFASPSTAGFGAALLALRAVTPEDLALKFRLKQSSPKNITPSEFEYAISQNSSRNESIDHLRDFATGVKSKGAKENAVQVKKPSPNRYMDEPILLSPTSNYGSVDRANSRTKRERELESELDTYRDVERERKETASVCSANILDFGSEGMGTLPFALDCDLHDNDHIGLDYEGGRKEKGVKWKDEVASDGNITGSPARLPPRVETSLSQRANAGGGYMDDWSRGYRDEENRTTKGDRPLSRQRQNDLFGSENWF